MPSRVARPLTPPVARRNDGTLKTIACPRRLLLPLWIPDVRYPGRERSAQMAFQEEADGIESCRAVSCTTVVTVALPRGRLRARRYHWRRERCLRRRATRCDGGSV